ncbi:MAG TPA: phosphatase PAP2 family protein [Kofleriaceae bacterium]|nr:phosphatase PAP2 family protein [Kofleriaceae bacterium]
MGAIGRWLVARVRWLRAPELRLLAILAVVVGLVLAFVALGSEVREGETLGFDRAILLFFRHTPSNPVGSHGVEAAAVHLSALGSSAVTTLVALIAVAFLALAGRRRYALLVGACAIGAGLWTTLLKHVYARPRPDFVTQIDPAGGQSFPSGHSTIAAALYLTLAVMIARTLPQQRLRVFVVATGALLALLIGLTRVYLGVHYPTDVLAGWTIGLAWALACGLLARWLGGRGKVEAAGPAGDTPPT